MQVSFKDIAIVINICKVSFQKEKVQIKSLFSSSNEAKMITEGNKQQKSWSVRAAIIMSIHTLLLLLYTGNNFLKK